jgi:hypothetical protein
VDIKTRFAHAEFVAEQYARFEDFVVDGMAFLGFPVTAMQEDIATFMVDGPRLRMVMAQRGEAKSTLAALYAVWRIIQRNQTRVLIVSGGEKQASEVATLVVRLIGVWDILEYLRPDRQAGDRSSIEAFDVHFSLKGLDKSPSVACVGITSNLPGKRADVLIADDIETTKNGLTSTQRGQLLHLTKEFTSICSHGDILYLGTPQTKDSVYNGLRGRGFCTRIWPGRFPTNDEIEKYGDKLAPYLRERIVADPGLQTGGGIDGKRGRPADPDRFDEHALCEKELDQGPEGFSLQYMLDTSLSDEARQQLRLSDLVVANFDHDLLPEVIIYQAAQSNAVTLAPDFPVPMTKMYHPLIPDCAFVKPKDTIMYIDPAGGGADELGFGVTTAVGPYIHLLDVGGLRGGLSTENIATLISVIKEFNITTVKCESNMGHGLFEINLRAELEKAEITTVGVLGEYSTGQKERRIIDSMVSAMQRHKVIVHKRVFESDAKYGKQHSLEKRNNYSFFAQLNNITTDRGSLVHDDRLEAAAGAIRHWKGVLALDDQKAAEARKLEDYKEYMSNPMGYANPGGKTPTGVRGAIQRRRKI